MPKKLYNEVEPGELMWMDWQKSQSTRTYERSRPGDKVALKKGLAAKVKPTAVLPADKFVITKKVKAGVR